MRIRAKSEGVVVTLPDGRVLPVTTDPMDVPESMEDLVRLSISELGQIEDVTSASAMPPKENLKNKEVAGA